MLTLVSNYQITEGLDYGEPFSAMADALNEAFGGSKKLEWWLEHTLNHTPKDYMVREITGQSAHAKG